MKIEIHHYHHVADPDIRSTLRRLEQRIIQMANDLTRITTEVSEMSTVVDSAVTLLGDLSRRIRENATDPVALNALADTLDSKGNALAAAVAANTVAADETGEADAPEGSADNG